MNVKFRNANINDVEEIINLCNECFEENTNLDYATENFKKTIYDENQIYLIGTIDDKIVAHTKITIIPTIFENMKTYSILNHVCVKKEYRRHDIATKMLKECEKISKEKNCYYMELWAKNCRVPAHKCYTKYGFTSNDAKFFSKNIN